MPKAIEQRMVRGIKALDRHRPGWREEVVVRKLDMASGERCVLGQLYGSYSVGLTAVGAGGPDRPFDWGFEDRGWKRLNELWREAVRAEGA